MPRKATSRAPCTWRVRGGKGRYLSFYYRRLPQSSTRLQIPEALLPKPNCQNIFHLLDYLVLLPATTDKIKFGDDMCKVNLEKEGVLTDATCDLCKKNDEDADHIIMTCDFARQF